jgi:hypothetical protein
MFGRDDYTFDKMAELVKSSEPVFLLRGQDPIAHHCVNYYARMLEGRMGDLEMVCSARMQAMQMGLYAKQSGKRLPDLPAGLFHLNAKVWVVEDETRFEGVVAGYDVRVGMFVVVLTSGIVVKVGRASLEERK